MVTSLISLLELYFKFRGVASLCNKFPLQNADNKINKINKK